MTRSTTQYHESSMTRDYPWGALVRVDGALCPDGVRRTAYPSGDGVADTFFSVPARVRITRDGARFTVSGYVTVETVDGWSTPSDEDPLTVKFRPYLYGRNGHLLADDVALADYVRKADHGHAGPYVDEAWGEMTRRGLYLVYNVRAPHGRGIYRLHGPDAGTFIRDEHGGLR